MPHSSKSAFTMVELVFVIVVLGILASIAMTKFAVTRDDAVVVKGKSQVSAIRSGISLLKSRRMMEGNTTVPQELDVASTAAGQTLFNGGAQGNVLEYALISKASDGNWMKTSDNTANPITYNFYLNSGTVTFNYSKTTGLFDCDHNNANCKLLAE